MTDEDNSTTGSDDSALIKVSTTSDEREILELIARELVRKKLVACAQISGLIDSTYTWQGMIESSPEWLLVAKSVQRQFENIKTVIESMHNYEVPQVIAEPIILASEKYANWVRDESSG